MSWNGALTSWMAFWVAQAVALLHREYVARFKAVVKFHVISFRTLKDTEAFGFDTSHLPVLELHTVHHLH